MLRDLVLRNRSYRRFEQDTAIDREMLEELVDLARLSATGGNTQALKFMLFCEPEQTAKVFPHLHWAGYLTDWDGPEEGERPSAYILILGDRDIKTGFGADHGIAAQTILLGANEQGLGGCMIGSVNRDDLRRDLDLSPRYEILLVLALGVPAETVVLETTDEDGGIKYWRDEEGVHHVPKRPLSELIIN